MLTIAFKIKQTRGILIKNNISIIPASFRKQNGELPLQVVPNSKYVFILKYFFTKLLFDVANYTEQYNYDLEKSQLIFPPQNFHSGF